MRLYFYSLLILSAVFIGQIAGNEYGLYLDIWVYDIAMHFLGGLGIALAVLATIKLHFKFLQRHRTTSVLILVFIAGILWEVFEAYYDIAGWPFGTTAYWIEFAKDLFDDMLGAVIALIIVRAEAD